MVTVVLPLVLYTLAHWWCTECYTPKGIRKKTPTNLMTGDIVNYLYQGISGTLLPR